MLMYLLGFISPFLFIGIYVGILNLYGNIRVQNKGKFIRSGQLSEKRFENLLDKHKVKTVINLRGTDDAPHEEVICKKKGIAYVGDISWDSDDLPNPEDLRKVVEVLEVCQEPVYVHCLAGADRSGEVAALYYIIKEGHDNKEALKNLTILYGHIPHLKPAKRFFIGKAWKGIEWAKTQYTGKL